MATFQHRHYVAIAKTIAAMPSFAETLRTQKESAIDEIPDLPTLRG